MKRYTALILAVSLCLTLSPVIITAKASAEPPGYTITSKGTEADTGFLSDGDWSTSLSLGSDATITLNASEPIRHIYLVWDKPPHNWEVVTRGDDGEKRYTFGKNGFIHEYVELPEPQNNLTLEFHGLENILCEVYAFDADTVPDWVQKWQPPYEDADMLLLPVRAGDEFLRFGATIPYYATERGMKVQLAYMTSTWEHPQRAHELLNALYSAGITAYPVISGFPEINAAEEEDVFEVYDIDAFFEFVVRQFRRFKPEVVVASGEYGDYADLVCFDAITVASSLSGDALEFSESSKKYGAFTVPKLYLHDFPENSITMDWSKASLEKAKGAYDAYSWRPVSSLEKDSPYDCRSFGLYMTQVGQDTRSDDFFENLPGGSFPGQSTALSAEGKAASDTALPVGLNVDAKDNPPSQWFDFNKLYSPYIPIAFVCLVAAALLRLKRD